MSFFTAATSSSCLPFGPVVCVLAPLSTWQPQANCSGGSGNSLSICKGSSRCNSSFDAAGKLKRRSETPREPMAQKARGRGCQLLCRMKPCRLAVTSALQAWVSRPSGARFKGSSRPSVPLKTLSQSWLISTNTWAGLTSSNAFINHPRGRKEWSPRPSRRERFPARAGGRPWK